MPERLRCGVIGTGAFGCDHLNSLLHCPKGTAVAIAESHPGRAKEAADRYKIARSYSDYRDLLDQPDIDAVTIAVPNHLHARIAIEALDARKHVLLEKPMATHAKDAARIVETARRTKRTLMVAQNLRFHRQTQTARLAIDRGDLGEVYHARSFWLRRSGIPRIGSWFTHRAQAGGGCLLDLGVHMLDLCLYLLGEFEVRSVFAQTAARFGPRNLGQMDWGKSDLDPKQPFDVEDHGVALLRLKSGRTVALEISWAGNHAADQPEQGLHLLGANAGLELFPARLFRPGPAGYETINLAAAAHLPQSEDRIHHFVACVTEGRKPLVAPEESLKVQRALDALYSSASAGKEVRLD
jgi:predicted dehydrogenase